MEASKIILRVGRHGGRVGADVTGTMPSARCGARPASRENWHRLCQNKSIKAQNITTRKIFDQSYVQTAHAHTQQAHNKHTTRATKRDTKETRAVHLSAGAYRPAHSLTLGQRRASTLEGRKKRGGELRWAS